MGAAAGESRGVFGVVRPYEAFLRERVFAFLGELGYEAGEGLVVPCETADEDAADWASTTPMDLLLLPYNKHRDVTGSFVDGVGVAMRLAHDFAERRVPIVMPVTTFSYRASFHRRIEELDDKRPDLTRCLVVLPEAELGSPDLSRRIRQVAG